MAWKVPQIQTKYCGSEDGEFTPHASCTREEVLNVVESYWTGENIPNGLEIIAITNENSESVTLEHSAKEAFEAYLFACRPFSHVPQKRWNPARLLFLHFAIVLALSSSRSCRRVCGVCGRTLNSCLVFVSVKM